MCGRFRQKSSLFLQAGEGGSYLNFLWDKNHIWLYKVEVRVVRDCSGKVLCVVGLLPAEGQSRTVAAQTARWTLSGNLWHPEVGAPESLCLLQADISMHCAMRQPWAQRDVMSGVWDNCHAALTSSVNLLTWLWQCCLTLLWPFGLLMTLIFDFTLPLVCEFILTFWLTLMWPCSLT